jgi:hypothetical protein
LIGTFERRFLPFEIAEASFGLDRAEALARLRQAADRLAQLTHLVVALLFDLESVRHLKAMQRPECLEALAVRLDRARVSPQGHVRLPRAVVRPRQQRILWQWPGRTAPPPSRTPRGQQLHADAIDLQRFSAIPFSRELGAGSGRPDVDERSEG